VAAPMPLPAPVTSPTLPVISMPRSSSSRRLHVSRTPLREAIGVLADNPALRRQYPGYFAE
jgi:hypothetical protein